MPAALPPAAKALKALQMAVRQKIGQSDTIALTVQISGKVTGGEPLVVPLTQSQLTAIEQAKASLDADLNFEYLPPDHDELWEFIYKCLSDEQGNHVPGFIEQHSRDAAEAICCFPVESLTVTAETTIGPVRLLPAGHEDAQQTVPLLPMGPTVGSVATVAVRGTNTVHMAARAKPVAARMLQVLRVAMREAPGYNTQQLRYRLADGYWFAGRKAGGLAASADQAWNNTLPEDLAGILGKPVAGLAVNAKPEAEQTRIEKKAFVALAWIERSYLTGDRVVGMLYLFFALEALLGDTAEGLKSFTLAFRQMMLGYVAEGVFEHPGFLLTMYVKIRNAAVHGEAVPEVTEDEAASFEWSVRDVLNNYLAVASENGFRDRSKFMKFLDEHPSRPGMVAWLRENGGPDWAPFLDAAEGA